MMGGIRENFGRITLESRRESFVIHAEYGYRPARIPRRDLMPGDWFRKIVDVPVGDGLADDTTAVQNAMYGGGPYHVLYISEDLVTYTAGDHRPNMPRDGTHVIPCDKEGEPLDVEDDPEAGVFEETWRKHGGPEFLNEDLDDLIAALVELRENPR